jgi:hypothetical protein
MAYSFTILAPPLHSTAEAAIKWFLDHWGLRKNSIHVEEEIDPDINLRPTFSAQTGDHHTLCIEVSISVYPNYLDAFVLKCRNKGLPVKLYTAVQKDSSETEYSKKLKAAKEAGIGILEVDAHSGTILQNAVSLSLTGVRPIDVRSFPKKYRQNLTDGEETFRGGNPSKACTMIFDEIEALFRKFARKAKSKGWWPNRAKLKIEKAPWAKIITDIDKNLDRKACGCPKLTPAFLARIHGVTPFRNESSHKPANARQLKKRDQELRTRFESGIDLFRDLVEATKKLHL